jgi:hypothetical protein
MSILTGTFLLLGSSLLLLAAVGVLRMPDVYMYPRPAEAVGVAARRFRDACRSVAASNICSLASTEMG